MYEIVFRPRAAQDFDKLDKKTATRVLKKLRWLSENFESIHPESLTGPFANLLKLRVGDYRVIYEADRERKVLLVRQLGHRREIYNQPA